MKKLFAAIAQFLLFLLLDGIGSIVYQPFHVVTKLGGDPTRPRMYVWDGLIFMAIAYVLLAVLAAARRRLSVALLWTTVALVLAGLAGYLLKLGFVTQGW